MTPKPGWEGSRLSTEAKDIDMEKAVAIHPDKVLTEANCHHAGGRGRHRLAYPELEPRDFPDPLGCRWQDPGYRRIAAELKNRGYEGDKSLN